LYIYDEKVEESRTFGTIKEYVTRIMSEDLLIDATQGDAEAQYSLGIHNLHEGNTSEAIEWLTKAAEQDATNDSVNNYHAVNNAREELMTYYAKIRDYDNAIYWYKKFTSNEDEDLDEIKYKLAKTIFPDDRYIDILQDAANMGNADAAVAMACIYAIGEDVERDDSKAVDYYRKYLEIIDNRKENVTIADIYYYIYRITDDGNIIKNLYGGGRNQWLEKAIEAGSDDAQYLMGNSYFIGYVVEQDYSQAIEWYQKAAEQGHKEAQYRLGTCYEDSLGVQQDYNLAAYWYKLSADQGYTLAQYKIAECLAEGNGIAVDKKLANEYYRKAAEGFKTMHEADVASKEAMGVYYEYDQDFPSVYEYADPVDESAEKDVAPIIDNN
jgi:TPR repeat protein